MIERSEGDEMNQIIDKATDEENGIEARLVETPNSYTVGTYDLDEGEYYPSMRIFPFTLEDALGKATAFFQKYVESKKINLNV